MLKKVNRLSTFGSIKNLKSVPTPYFVLKYKKEEAGVAKFGFIVSKKIDKRAVVRNKIKRVLQEAVRENLERIYPYTFLIIAKKEIINESFEKIENTMSEVLKKEKLIK